ncbi:uncharacterized protein PAC_08557 [Phialocephala subalpina]|uniref:2EXR domain-containing protein n=1 Tax=Phialocephala subalpina TaxID=576137 RepID=A0A1L7X0X0_9HELO|nr:uncharacterized protein PAC_08557 [Phialocephala subalpina]
MRLRNRTIGVGGTFYPFKRLPIELRQMIWRLTLEPRVVEVRWTSTRTISNKVHDPLDIELHFIETDHDPNELMSLDPANEIRYYSTSNAKLPINFRVCRDSRHAVDALYPLCFASKSHSAGVRFNLSLDTLFFDEFFDQRVYSTPYNRIYSPSDKRLFGFFENLSPTEKAKLANIAFADEAGDGVLEDDSWSHKYWEELGTWIGKLTGLKSILTVHDIASALEAIADDSDHERPDRADSLDLAARGYRYYGKDRYVKFLDDFPDELVERFQISAEEFPILGGDSDHRGRGDWLIREQSLPGAPEENYHCEAFQSGTYSAANAFGGLCLNIALIRKQKWSISLEKGLGSCASVATYQYKHSDYTWVSLSLES